MSTVKRGIARPCTTDEDLVCVGQPVCALPSGEGCIGGGVTGGAGNGRAWKNDGGASSAQGAPDCGGCWQGTRGAHPKYAVHGRDAGGVEAQRLVECRRVLSSRKGCMRRGATCGPGDGGAWKNDGGASSAQGAPEAAGRARARTSNMPSMFVTLEVSRLSGWLNDHASCRVETDA